MNLRGFVPFVVTSTILSLNLPVYANGLQLNPEDQAFCNSVYNQYTKDFTQMNPTSRSRDDSIGIQFPVKGIPI